MHNCQQQNVNKEKEKFTEPKARH